MTAHKGQAMRPVFYGLPVYYRLTHWHRYCPTPNRSGSLIRQVSTCIRVAAFLVLLTVSCTD